MGFRTVLGCQAETKSPQRDLLLRLFETHLLNALVEGHSATRLLEDVRAEYISSLKSLGTIPQEEWGAVLDMLEEDLRALLRESVVRHALKSFGDFVASVGEVAPLERLRTRRRST
jgi:hypothetical protein